MTTKSELVLSVAEGDDHFVSPHGQYATFIWRDDRYLLPISSKEYIDTLRLRTWERHATVVSQSTVRNILPYLRHRCHFDPVKQFASECLVPGDWESTNHLFAAYTQFAEQRGLQLLSKFEFSKRLEAKPQRRGFCKGFRITIREQCRIRDGLALAIAKAS